MKAYELHESYKNLLEPNQKEQYKLAVWDMLQKAYKSIGGIHGAGFESPDDMVKNIAIWKLNIVHGELLAVVMYKDTPSGRKTVALATNFQTNGKKALVDMMRNDLSRSYVEISDAAERFLKRAVPNWEQYQIPSDQVQDLLGKDVDTIDANYYSRKIGSDTHTKTALGTPGNHIK